MNVDGIILNLLRLEGGVKDVGDGKGITRFGQTPAWLEQWKLPAPQNATEAAANYRKWLERSRYLALLEPCDALATTFVDYAVNSDEFMVVRALQTMLGVKADGVVGPNTIQALDGRDRAQLARRLVAHRGKLFLELLKNPQKRKYAPGWFARYIEQTLEVLV